MDTAEDGEGGTNWESSMDMYTLPRVNRWEAVYTTGSPALHSAMTWRGGRETQEGGNIYIVLSRTQHNVVKYIYCVEQNSTQHCEAIILQSQKTKQKLSPPLQEKRERNRPLKVLVQGLKVFPYSYPPPPPHHPTPPLFRHRRLRDIKEESSALADPGEKPWGLSSSPLWGMHQLVWLVWHHNFPSLWSSGWGCVYGNRSNCSCQLRQDLSPLLATSSPTPTARYSWKLLESVCAGAT